MRQGLAAVLLCVLAVSAGCSALPGSGGGGTPAAEEVPGIEDGQLENETALLDAHVEAVTETGFAQEIRTNATTVRQGEAIEVSQRQRTRVTAGATEYRYQTVTSGGVATRFIAWGNETIEVRRAEAGGGEPQYQSTDPEDAATLAGRTLLETRLTSAFEVVDVEERENGPDVVTLEVDGLPENNSVFAGQDRIGNVSGFEAELVVDTEGRVHSYAAAAVYDVEGQTGNYEFTFQMTSFEDPGVERPEWADSA
ncbi:hypothetical protein [Natronomonas marina]|jgi:hypothetical protein|uniref:hypothetical protein n=1 Tax=Natronomonas marina TaxID=2961939 RepID=UPI0020C9C827|nr:hypothetical protein [Natronomonas marina]